MAYNKYTWHTGEVITEGKLNHMEKGIADNDFAISSLKSDVSDINDELFGISVINFTAGKRLNSDGTVTDDNDKSVSEKIPISWTGYGRYYCNDNTSTDYYICFYDASDNFLNAFRNPSIPGSVDYRNINADTQVTGTPSYVRFSFKRNTIGKVTNNENPPTINFWEATNEIESEGLTQNIDAVRTLLGSSSITAEADTLDSGAALTLSNAPWFIKKNHGITARAKFSTFNNIIVGKGYNSYRGKWIVIDGTNITPYSYENAATAGTPIPHGLTISDFVQVAMFVPNDGKCRISINSLGGTFTTEIEYLYEWNYAPFIIGNQAMTDVKLSYSCADLRSPLWLFGDSYMGIAVNRVGGQLKNLGYFSYCICAIAGGRAVHTEVPGKSLSNDMMRMLAITKPNFIIWALGMNGGDTMNIGYLSTLISLCEDKGIELILYMPPSVPTIDHSDLNEAIAGTNIRYIDGNAAVGANSEGEWYGHGTEDDYLSPDGVHPSVLGAKALALRFLADAPELMQYGYSTGTVDEEIDGDEH